MDIPIASKYRVENRHYEVRQSEAYHEKWSFCRDTQLSATPKYCAFMVTDLINYCKHEGLTPIMDKTDMLIFLLETEGRGVLWASY